MYPLGDVSFCVDLLVEGRFLELNNEVDHGDIKGRNTQSHAGEFVVLEWHAVNLLTFL